MPSFSEQQLLEFLYGKSRAEDLMEEQDEQQFDYYRKVYRNWQSGKEYTWNWGAGIFSYLWLLCRGMYLYFYVLVFLEPIIMLLPESTPYQFVKPIIPFFVFGFFGNTFLKYWLEYQLKKNPSGDIPKGASSVPMVICSVMALFSPLFPLTKVIALGLGLNHIVLFFETENVLLTICALILLFPLFLHLYYYHIKPRFKFRK